MNQEQFQAKVRQGRVCPYCGDKPKAIPSEQIYGKGHNYGFLMACRKCEAFVGCHKGTKTPMGRLASQDLRTAKRKAHFFFDQLWRKKMEEDNMPQGRARSLAYSWLAEQMGISTMICHIGMFDLGQCEWVVDLCKPFAKDKVFHLNKKK